MLKKNRKHYISYLENFTKLGNGQGASANRVGDNRNKQVRDSWRSTVGESWEVSIGLPSAKTHASNSGRGSTGLYRVDCITYPTWQASNRDLQKPHPLWTSESWFVLSSSTYWKGKFRDLKHIISPMVSFYQTKRSIWKIERRFQSVMFPEIVLILIIHWLQATEI